MSDPLRPYGDDTLIIPFTWVPSGASRQVGPEPTPPSGEGQADDNPRRGHAPTGANPRSAE